jgi:citrate synthase
MAETVNVKNMGLRGVTVADTKVSFIDGEKGILIYRGYRIEDLAEKSSFMEVAHLLLKGSLPNQGELEAFESQVVEARSVPEHIFACFAKWPREARPMDVLQAAIPMLAMVDPELEDDTRDANIRQAIRLLARLPGLVAGWHRIRQGLDPLPSDNTLSHGADFLWQLHGDLPDQAMARDLDTCLTLHADHTFNASTFACREVVSTRAHMYAGVTAGIGALSGSLHGGANTQVMAMLYELELEQDIPAWVKRQIESGKRIMGMGHAVYKTMDPRARFLKAMGSRLAKTTGQERLHDLSTQIEEASIAAFKERGKTTLQPNVDFYSAPVYHMMGIPGDLMTPVFAMARVPGWSAHIIEEKFAEAQEKPALYRPKAEYVGQYCGLMGCTFEPMDGRE